MAASPATTDSRYVRSPTGSAASRRPLPFPPSRIPVPAEPLPVPTPAPAPPPLNVAPSHTNFLLDRFVGGFRKLYRPNIRRRGSSVSQEPTDVENNAANAAGFSQSPPGTYEEPVTVHVAQDGHTFVPDTASAHLAAVPGPPGGFYSPSSAMSPQSGLAPSIHHTSRAPSVRIEYAEPLPTGAQSGYHSRASSMARNDVSARHSRAPSDNGDDDEDGEGDHATAVGHGDGVSVVRSQTAPTSTPYITPHFINGLADGAPSKETPSPPRAKTSPYGSTFAAIANAIQHVRSLPWVTQIVTEEWKPPNTRVGPPSASQSWYTEGPRSASLYPGSGGPFFPPNYYPGPQSQPLTTTMNLSPGTISPPYMLSPDGRPWPPGTQYYYNPQYNTQPLISPAPPPPPAHPHMSSPMDQTPSLLLRNSTLQPPPSTYLNAGGSVHRSRAASSAYGHAQ